MAHNTIECEEVDPDQCAELIKHTSRKKMYSSIKCSMVSCNNSKFKKPYLSFFHFPKEEARYKEWCEICNDFTSKKSKMVCEEHFTDKSFIISNCKRLKNDAKPSRTYTKVEEREDQELDVIKRMRRQLTYWKRKSLNQETHIKRLKAQNRQLKLLRKKIINMIDHFF